MEATIGALIVVDSYRRCLSKQSPMLKRTTFSLRRVLRYSRSLSPSAFGQKAEQSREAWASLETMIQLRNLGTQTLLKKEAEEIRHWEGFVHKIYSSRGKSCYSNTLTRTEIRLYLPPQIWEKSLHCWTSLSRSMIWVQRFRQRDREVSWPQLLEVLRALLR